MGWIINFCFGDPELSIVDLFQRREHAFLNKNNILTTVKSLVLSNIQVRYMKEIE